MKKISPKNDAERAIMKENYEQKGFYGESLKDILTSRYASDEEKSKARATLNQRNEADLKKHREAVLNYKNAWRAKNPLWKLFHLSYSPKKVNLNSMNMYVINNTTEKMIGKRGR